jgi:hypothetical protein
MRYLILLSLLFTLLSCKSDSPKTDEKMKSAQAVDFSQVDEACACSLQLESAEEKDDLFFVFNLKTGPGVINLNGEHLLLDRGASLNSDNAGRAYLHQNERYQVQTSLVDGAKDDDGAATQSGRIKIKDTQTNEQTIFKVVGVCKC